MIGKGINTERFLVVLGISLIIVSCVLQIIMGYHVDRDVTDWKTRAHVAGDVDQMYPYLENLQRGMEDYGMTHGYAAIIFKKPDNDMSMIYESVVRTKEQAKKLKELDRNSDAYYQGFDDIRGRLAGLDLHAPYFYLIHDAIYMLLLFVVGIVCSIIGFLLQINIKELVYKNPGSLLWIFFVIFSGGITLNSLPIEMSNLFFVGMFIFMVVLSPRWIKGGGCLGGNCSNESGIAEQKYREAEGIYNKYHGSVYAEEMYTDISRAYTELYVNKNHKKSIEHSQKIIDRY